MRTRARERERERAHISSTQVGVLSINHIITRHPRDGGARREQAGSARARVREPRVRAAPAEARRSQTRHESRAERGTLSRHKLRPLVMPRRATALTVGQSWCCPVCCVKVQSRLWKLDATERIYSLAKPHICPGNRDQPTVETWRAYSSQPDCSRQPRSMGGLPNCMRRRACDLMMSSATLRGAWRTPRHALEAP